MEQNDINKTDILLETFSEELQSLKVAVTNLGGNLTKIENAINAVAENTARPPVVNASVDIKPVIAALQLGMDKVKATVEAQPKAIVRKIQLLHYPPEQAKQIYNRICGWATLAVFSIVLTVCGYQYLTRHDAIQQQIQWQEVENDRTRKAWNELYRRENKKGKRRMDSVYVNFHAQVRKK